MPLHSHGGINQNTRSYDNNLSETRTRKREEKERKTKNWFLESDPRRIAGS